MSKPPIKPGTVVRSRAGRDKDRYMIVLAMESPDMALVVDGDLRKLAAPKRKKLMHLVPTACFYEPVTETGHDLQDARIRKFLQMNGYAFHKQED